MEQDGTVYFGRMWQGQHHAPKRSSHFQTNKFPTEGLPKPYGNPTELQDFKHRMSLQACLCVVGVNLIAHIHIVYIYIYIYIHIVYKIKIKQMNHDPSTRPQTDIFLKTVIWESSGKHLEGIWEAPGDSQMLQEAPGSSRRLQETPGGSESQESMPLPAKMQEFH